MTFVLFDIFRIVIALLAVGLIYFLFKTDRPRSAWVVAGFLTLFGMTMPVRFDPPSPKDQDRFTRIVEQKVIDVPVVRDQSLSYDEQMALKKRELQDQSNLIENHVNGETN